MDSTAFQRIRYDFLKSRVESVGAALGSLGSAISYALLLVLLYLFVDLLASKGEIPIYAQLSPAQQREFADEWSSRSEADRVEAIKPFGLSDVNSKRVAGADVSPPPTSMEWELRWRAGVSLALHDRVGAAAAETYLPITSAESGVEPDRKSVV